LRSKFEIQSCINFIFRVSSSPIPVELLELAASTARELKPQKQALERQAFLRNSFLLNAITYGTYLYITMNLKMSFLNPLISERERKDINNN
jgi:hypothetical protein